MQKSRDKILLSRDQGRSKDFCGGQRAKRVVSDSRIGRTGACSTAEKFFAFHRLEFNQQYICLGIGSGLI